MHVYCKSYFTVNQSESLAVNMKNSQLTIHVNV